LHPAITLAVPAGIEPQAALVTYLVFILYPAQLSVVGGVFVPHVAPSSKLYSIVNSLIVAGGVTVNKPQPGLTTGAGGEGGKITTFTILLSEQAFVVPATVVPQSAAKIYCACIEWQPGVVGIVGVVVNEPPSILYCIVNPVTAIGVGSANAVLQVFEGAVSTGTG
jgi:hypothetical protein